MKVWLPHVRVGAGADVYTRRLAAGLVAAGCTVEVTGYRNSYQYVPWALRPTPPDPDFDIVCVNCAWGFPFKGTARRLVAVEHHCVNEPAYRPYRSAAQAVFHRMIVAPATAASLRRADAVVTVSTYTADSLARVHGFHGAHVIHNGIETDVFTPPAAPREPLAGRPVRLLFVGNLTRRKGADLLLPILEALGEGYELDYTLGLRTADPFAAHPRMRALGRLTDERLRDAYRRADLLLFPTRFEGFGYTAAEAMACGTPVVTTRASAMPEVVEDGVTGRLCPPDDVGAFAGAIRDLVSDPARLARMRTRCREETVRRFSLAASSAAYVALFRSLL